MNLAEYLLLTRNHSSDVRATLLFADTTLNAESEGYVNFGIPAIQTGVGEAYDYAIARINAMKDALDELE